MNIHFDSNILKYTLDKLTVSKFVVGSHMYSTNTLDSDTDLLSIYLEPQYNRGSFLYEHHQLQYKDNIGNIDYNYTTLQTFIRNIITGDSTINFEVLFSDQLINTHLAWLCEFKYDLINYNIIKSYLGIAKRDLGMYKKMGKRTPDANKKLMHFVRGVLTADKILKYNKNLKDINIIDVDLKGIKLGTVQPNLYYYEQLMNNLRNELNTKLNNNTINKVPSVDVLIKLDTYIKDFTEDFDNTNKVLFIEYNSIFYSDLGKDIKY